MIEIIFNQRTFKPSHEEQQANSFIRYVVYDSIMQHHYVVSQWRGTTMDGYSEVYVLSKGMYDTKMNVIYTDTTSLVRMSNKEFPILEANPTSFVKKWFKIYDKNVSKDVVKYERIVRYLTKQFSDGKYYPTLFVEVKKNCRWLQLAVDISKDISVNDI